MKKYKEIDAQEVAHTFETTLTPVENIARQFKARYSRITDIIDATFSEEFIAERKRQRYAASKTGDKNPMWKMFGDKHPRYRDDVRDGSGYLMVLKPNWYTGRAKSKYVFKHTLVMCEAMGLTEMPKGFHVHHIDEDKTHNTLDNLALVSVNGHARIHSLQAQRLAEMRREYEASEMQRIFRSRKLSAREDGDIVHSPK